MTGVFDSGSGGRFALRILHKLSPFEELVFLADRENAPYGVRSESEIISLAEANISRLAALGCQRVLIACCTASTVYPHLSDEARKIAIPILDETARVASEATRRGRIAVIATNATVRSGEFTKAIKRYDPNIEVAESATQELVALVDRGGGFIGEGHLGYISAIAERVILTGADTLVLGCTHFHAVKDILLDLFKKSGQDITVISSAEVGAGLAYEKIKRGAAIPLGKETGEWENTGEAGLTMPSQRSLLSRSVT